MKKPVRTVSIRDGNFRKGDGKFRLYSYKNAGYAERVKTAALHTLKQARETHCTYLQNVWHEFWSLRAASI